VPVVWRAKSVGTQVLRFHAITAIESGYLLRKSLRAEPS
jgi:hypothetical protein